MDGVVASEMYSGTDQNDKRPNLCACKIENRDKSPLKDTSNRDANLKLPSSSRKVQTHSGTLGENSDSRLKWVTCSCGERYLAKEAPAEHRSRSSLGKRQRVIMDFVELSSVERIKREIKLEADLKALLHSNVKKEEEEDVKPLHSSTIKGKTKKSEDGDNKKLKKSKKEKNEGLRLSSDSLHKRLFPIGLDVFPISVHRDISDLLMHRYFISNTYGGSPQVTNPVEGFLCITLSRHPYGPAVPGAPGLYFQPGDSRKHAEKWCKSMGEVKLIIRIQKGVWQYMGQYVFAPSIWLTVEEWRGASQQTRDDWVREVWWTQEWGRSERIRVYLWKTTGRRPTEPQIDRLFKKDEKDYKDLVTTEDIEEAFWEGVIPIGVYTLKCIGYDEDFARKNAREHPLWLQARKKKAKAKKAKESASAGSGSTNVKPEFVKRELPDEDEDKVDLELGKRVKRRKIHGRGSGGRDDSEVTPLAVDVPRGTLTRSISPEV